MFLTFHGCSGLRSCVDHNLICGSFHIHTCRTWIPWLGLDAAMGKSSRVERAPKPRLIADPSVSVADLMKVLRDFVYPEGLQGYPQFGCACWTQKLFVEDCCGSQLAPENVKPGV